MKKKSPSKKIKDNINKIINSSGNGNIFERLSKFSIFALVFLVPLFFLPFTANILDFNKQFLLLFLILISSSFFILNILKNKQLVFNRGQFFLPIALLLLISGLSAAFSSFGYGSFWGWPLSVATSFLSLLYFVFLYFLIINLFNKKEVFSLLFTLALSVSISAFLNLFQLFGKFIFPWDFAKFVSFNTVGTPYSFSILLAVFLPIVIILSLVAGKIRRWFLLFSGLLILANLILINFKFSWMILILELAIIAIFGIYIFDFKKNRTLFSSLFSLLVISLIFIVFGASFSGIISLPNEVSPSYKSEIDIIKKEILNYSFLGSGPGTFLYEYSKHKSPDINQGVAWNIRFENGPSEILDKIITTGFLGLVAFIFLVWVFFKTSFNYLKEHIFENKNSHELLLALGMFSLFGGLFFGQFLYSINFTLLFVFFLILSLFAVLDEKIINTFKVNSDSKIKVSAVSVVVLIFGFGLFLFASSKYIADVKYVSAMRYLKENNLDLAIKSLEKSINLNPAMDLYHREIANLYLIKLNQDLGKGTAGANTQNLISLSVNYAERSVISNPVNSLNWNLKGFVYQNLISLFPEADSLAITSYQGASKLDPSNPYMSSEIARIYIGKLDSSKEGEIEENLNLAKINIDKSLSLKNDFAPANFLKAVILLRENKINEAILQLQITKQLVPFDSGVSFQLGFVYYNNNQLQEAKAEFNNVLSLDGSNQNAMYFLGLVYDKEGNAKEAILQFEKLEKLNPENEEIKTILSNLKSGKSALEGILPEEQAK